MDLLDKMATYVRVVEAGSFSAAAKQLRLSAAAVSRQIATLEKGLKVTLLERTTRRMVVTPAGQRYYERCRQILTDVEDAQTTGRREAFEGLLKVSAPVTFGLACVVPLLRPLMVEQPGLVVDLKLEDVLVDLALEGVDIAIRVGSVPHESAELVAQPLFSFRRVVVASLPYLQRVGVPKTPEGLARLDALTFSAQPSPDVWRLTDGAREASVRLKVAFRSNALHAVRQLAMQHAGVALLPEWFVRTAVKKRALRLVLPTWKTGTVNVNAIYRTRHRGAPRVRAFIEHLRRAFSSYRFAESR